MEIERTSLSMLRKSVIERLKYHYAHGNLEEEDFENMLEKATNAEVKDALVPIHNMLSPIPSDERGSTESKEIVVRKEYATFMNILSGIEKKGIWNVAKKIRCVNILGGAELNLSQCELNNEETVFEVLCLLGGMEIIIPDNAQVIVEGVPILGGIEDSSNSDDNNGPRIIIRGVVALGGIEIRHMNKRERKKIKKK